MKPININKVLLHPGYLPPENLAELINENKSITLIRHNNKGIREFEKHKLTIEIYPEHQKSTFSNKPIHDSIKPWLELINDHQTSLIFHRTSKNNSEISKFSEILFMSHCYQLWLEDHNPDMLIFTSTPHNTKNWVMAKVAESIGIPVIYFQESFFPWKQFILEGLTKTPKILPPSQPTQANFDYKFLSDYLIKKTGSQDEAMPDYEIKRLKENNWRMIGIKKEAKNIIKNPIKSVQKIKSYLSYKKLCKDINLDKYVVFFLHYQPERTTIPEGYGFGIQIAAIIALQQALPKNTYLVVKEHPSTYTYNFSSKYKNKEFYETISSIDRVVIAPITADPYKLIDKSIATASITGTVIGEAFVRGKPSIAFGAGPMQAVNSELFHRYESIEKLQSFLRTPPLPQEDHAKSYFDKVRQLTACGITSETTVYNEKDRQKYLITSAINGLKTILANKTTTEQT